MRTGFFSLNELDQLARHKMPDQPQCTQCKLDRFCHSPHMKACGLGQKGILIVGEAPGEEEDKRGRPFVGPAGQLLDYELHRVGIHPHRDCWKTNACRCRPQHNKKPSTQMIQSCRPALFQDIKRLKPKHIILLGRTAIEGFIGHYWKNESFPVDRWMPWNIPSQDFNCWVSPLYHTSYLLRQNDELANVLFRQGLHRAATLLDRPWKTKPDYEKQIEIIYNPSHASHRIDDIQSGIISFDFEANCLKPEYPEASIRTCSICDGKHTFAFPWTEKTAQAMGRVLHSEMIGKIGYNAKFEDRWTRFHLGYSVRRWVWDGMLAAHVLCHQPGVTSLKFQAFVRLGQKPYDTHIKAYLKTTGREHLNRITQVPLKDILLYNGMDSLMAYAIARIQKQEIENGTIGHQTIDA